MAGWILSSASLWFLVNPLWWPYIAGAAALAVCLPRIIKEVSSARGLDRITLFGPIFLATPMAVFAGDHFVFAKSIANLVPSWIPWHLFWAFFVGVCLLAGALSLAVDRYAGLAAVLFGTMLFLFVLLMDVPAILETPGDRIVWALTLRDLTFGAGALSFAAARAPARWTRPANIVLILVRLEIGLAAIFYGVEHFLHPEFKPAVPLEQLTPLWFPLRVPMGYLTGAVLVITGTALVANKDTKLAATALGLFLFLLVIVVYVPITIAEPLVIDNGLNYLGDTLMFSGAVLCLAGSYRAKVNAYEGGPAVLSMSAGKKRESLRRNLASSD